MSWERGKAKSTLCSRGESGLVWVLGGTGFLAISTGGGEMNYGTFSGTRFSWCHIACVHTLKLADFPPKQSVYVQTACEEWFLAMLIPEPRWCGAWENLSWHRRKICQGVLPVVSSMKECLPVLWPMHWPCWVYWCRYWLCGSACVVNSGHWRTVLTSPREATLPVLAMRPMEREGSGTRRPSSHSPCDDLWSQSGMLNLLHHDKKTCLKRMSMRSSIGFTCIGKKSSPAVPNFSCLSFKPISHHAWL